MNKPVRNPFSTLSHWFKTLETWCLVLLVAFLVGFSLFQIVARNFFSTGFPWGDTLLRHVLLWVSLLGTARATAEDRHISIDILPRLLPAKGRFLVTAVCNGFSAFICAVLCYSSWNFLMDERTAGYTAFAGVRNWWLEVIFPVSFAVMTARFGYRTVRGFAEGPAERKA